MKDFDEEDWGDMPNLNQHQGRDVLRLGQTLKSERARINKLAEAGHNAGFTSSGTVRGDDSVDRTPLFQKVYSGKPTSDERLRQLIGDAPLPDYSGYGDRYASETAPISNDPMGRLPIPT